MLGGRSRGRSEEVAREHVGLATTMATNGFRMKIGTAPITWGVCELPDWGEVLPYERVLDEMTELGYAGTELGPWGYLPKDAASLAKELGKRSLALAGAFCPVTLHDPRRYDDQVAYAMETCRLLADLGSPVLVLAEAGGAERERIAGRVRATDPRFSEEDWKRFAEGANEIARRAKDMGLVTAFHPHAGTYVETPGEIDELLRRTDASLVGLCLDTGHVFYGGGDPVALARRERSRVRHVHLKDVYRDRYERALSRKLDFTAAVGEDVFAPVGAGSIDMSGVLDALRDAGFAGWLIVEQDVRLVPGSSRQPKLDAAKSYSFITAKLR
jgi:inosose dehydratase